MILVLSITNILANIGFINMKNKVDPYELESVTVRYFHCNTVSGDRFINLSLSFLILVFSWYDCSLETML